MDKVVTPLSLTEALAEYRRRLVATQDDFDVRDVDVVRKNGQNYLAVEGYCRCLPESRRRRVTDIAVEVFGT